MGGSQPGIVSLAKRSSSLLSISLDAAELGDGGWAKTGGIVEIGIDGAGGEWSGAGDCDLDNRRDDRFSRETHTGCDRTDRRVFAMRRQSGLEVCERCAVCDVKFLRHPRHICSSGMIR